MRYNPMGEKRKDSEIEQDRCLVFCEYRRFFAHCLKNNCNISTFLDIYWINETFFRVEGAIGSLEDVNACILV